MMTSASVRRFCSQAVNSGAPRWAPMTTIFGGGASASANA
jgi:hypothetical protein